MKYPIALLTVVAAAAPAYPAAADEIVPFKVVVHAGNPTSSLPVAEVAKLFLHKQKRWADGTRVAPVDQDARSELREAFTKAIHGRTTSSIERYWQRQIYGGTEVPPPELGTDALVLDFVAREPGAIGYVSAHAPPRAAIKILAIPDLRGYDVAAFTAYAYAAGADSGDRAVDASSGDETLSRHGDLRLFVTGSCGPGDLGRQAIVQNRDPDYSVGAEIETSTWHDGRLRSSSVRHHSLQPLAEKRLGCTRRGGDVEVRYAIVRASSATSHRVDHHPRQPARSVVAIVDSGSCGQGRKGTWRSVINRHTSHWVAVRVEVRELVDGKVRRRYLKNHRLAPGATRRLGCGADGSMIRRFTLLEADYRP